MGELADYWNDHKNYKKDNAHRLSLGVSWAEYKEMDRKIEKETRLFEESLKIHKCVCGKGFKTDGQLHDHYKTSKKTCNLIKENLTLKAQVKELQLQLTQPIQSEDKE